MLLPLILRPAADLPETHPHLIRQAKTLSQAYARKEIINDNQLRVMGNALWLVLDADETLQKAKHQAGESILPIVIESDNPAVLELPWETLWHSEYEFLALHKEFILSRTSPTITVHMPDIEPGPLRILLFTTLPDDLNETDQLQIEEEQSGVLEALGPWLQSGHVVLEMPDDGRFSLFEELLQTFRPHLVWLSGHGVFLREQLNHDHKGFFLFEDENTGNGSLVDEDTLAGAFRGTAVQGVVLSACQSGKAVSSDLNNGLMYALAQKGMPHVIGMRESILDRTGIQFARGFFTALLEKRNIAEALRQARSAIMKPLQEDEDAKRYLYAEHSLGQWCLPILLSRQHDRPLIKWQFTPHPPELASLLNESLDNISLPSRFIGRRRELRALQREFRDGRRKVLLVTGAGGVGKTAFAGKLVDTLKNDGFMVYGFSARPEHNWRDTLFQMELALNKERTETYNKIRLQYSDSVRLAHWLLKLLLEQHGRKVALFFDNIESVQDTTTLKITNPELLEWIEAARGLQQAGLRILITSRYSLPGWEQNTIHPLGSPVYRDFLAVAQQKKLPKEFLKDSRKLRRAYAVLGGNFRALEYFAEALKDMGAAEEKAFLGSLKKAEAEIQTNMLLDKVWEHRTGEERELLRRMTAYPVPVAQEGITVIANPDLTQSQELLNSLLSVSLVERYHNAEWKVDEYRISPIVRNWLGKQKEVPASTELLQRAAGYQQWLLESERGTLEQAMITHAALMVAGMNEEAHKVTLAWIVGPMNMAGRYNFLLNNYLLPACKSTVTKTLAEAIGQSGIQYLDIGKFDEALDFFERSLAIWQMIGDRQGEGVTLGNIAQIYHARGEYDEAIKFLNMSLAILHEISNRRGESATLNNIAEVYGDRGQYDSAIKFLKQSLVICQEIGDRQGEGVILNNIANNHTARGHYNKAIECLKRSLTIRKKIGDRQGAGITLSNIANNYRERGEYDEALDLLKQSLAIQQEIGDRMGEGATFNTISQIYHGRGQYNEALGFLERSLAIQQEIGDRKGEGATLNNISQIYHIRGQYDEALGFLERSLAIQQEIGDRKGEGATLNNISQIYHIRGQYDEALVFLERSLAIQQEIGNRQGECITLNNIAGIHQARQQSDEALNIFKRSLAIQQEIADKRGEGVTLNNIASIFYERGQYDEALNIFNQSLAIQQEIGNSSGCCGALFNIGQIHKQKNDMNKAFSAWIAVYRIAREINYAQALQALAELADQFSLPQGLDGWEKLAEQMDEQQD
ncbi:MAG: tetratricopeptide repeat protein [Chlorobium limicola]|uniref:tetratricopeptide repeat protein n=1 Tax=Chlorobium limicola TaxID=1092 RepID=UPI0023F288BE|nr:tetratricopeptide repeat protein [Chlorobium limicola]NTV21743.1 tetratricopeptide repeat protein [Chlorobium limicola]